MCRPWQERALSFRELTALISLELGKWEPVIFESRSQLVKYKCLRTVASFTVKNDKEKQQTMTSKKLQPAED